MKLLGLFLLLLSPALAEAAQPAGVPAHPARSWSFVVSGDSRNCGDLIMPVIARGAIQRGARFYWHLGDLRALYEIDEDYAGLHKLDLDKLKLGLLPQTEMDSYLKAAWPDFLENQLRAFKVPFFLGIGNHEAIGRTRDQFLAFFHDQLNTPAIQKQRELDSPGDSTVRTYYHWRERNVDFLYLDNSSSSIDADQLAWFMATVTKIEADSTARALIVGMHESLPYSYSFSHSMNSASDQGASGLAVYQRLLDYKKKGKPVYIFSSHSHYFLADLFNTSYWQSHGGALPGYLIGTAGAQHYSIPPEVKEFAQYAENQYGYLVVTVNEDPKADDPLALRFVRVTRKDLLPDAVRRFGAAAVKFCFSENWNASVPGTR
jgi:hypothetical protein